jgi:hypothetical protein
MKKLSLVKKQTKFTMNATIDCQYLDSECEFKISQNFCSENTDSEELLNELIYFIKRGSFIPVSKKLTDHQMYCDMDYYYIYFESFWNDEEVSDFFEKLSTRLNDLFAFDIECSDEILSNLNQEQIENFGDGGWSIFVKNNPEYTSK